MPPTNWRQDAECRDADPELFFPATEPRGKLIARQFCSNCPVITQCGREAWELGHEHGLWGGITERQRRRLKREHALLEARFGGRGPTQDEATA